MREIVILRYLPGFVAVVGLTVVFDDLIYNFAEIFENEKWTNFFITAEFFRCVYAILSLQLRIILNLLYIFCVFR